MVGRPEGTEGRGGGGGRGKRPTFSTPFSHQASIHHAYPQSLLHLWRPPPLPAALRVLPAVPAGPALGFPLPRLPGLPPLQGPGHVL